MEDDLNGDGMALRSSQPLKAQRRRIKILESKTFQTQLKKARVMKNKICIVEMRKRQSEIEVKIRQSHTHRNIEITNEIICDCAQQQTAARKTCHHVVWVFLYFFEKRETDKLLAQTDIVVSSFQRLLNQVPDSIPNALKVKNDGVREYNQKLRDHEKFDLP